jgi:23S rRNA pseudouridine1911/1915/1917 synthase
LDKLVSGIMIVPRTQETWMHFKRQFQERTIQKEYLALVHGVIKADEGDIRFSIARSKKTGKMTALPLGSENHLGREALTEFTVLKRYAHATYLSLTIKTGRTHQIRVHLRAYGYPIVGDSLYRLKSLKSRLKLDRIFLHSHKLVFFDREGKSQSCISPLPRELAKILENLK